VITDLAQKARRYRDLADAVVDEALHAEITKLAAEYEERAIAIGGSGRSHSKQLPQLLKAHHDR
jgi:predicted urease superfamily metal-dependent hydrolase